jgi:adenosylmethionine-8-amino-7-oxononanoate aminotransferase
MPVPGSHIWHPFTQMKTADPPIHISHGKGATLFAADGNTYIDAISSWWVNIHGHANETIAKAIARQALELEHVIFAGFTHTPAIELSEKLIEVLPGNLSKIFFSDNGSTSVEVAIKMAIQYWHNKGIRHKTKIVAFENAYHGDTFGAMSAGARSPFSAAFDPLLFDVIHIPTPEENNIASLITSLDNIAQNGDIAAFIYEPLVQGAAGMLMYEANWLDQLLSAIKQKKIICIADEVMTGFGRTGKNFATEHLQHKADIICVSKGITGGFLPLGITACTHQIFDAFYADDNSKTFYHGHSYTGNPLSCAAANASISLLLDEKCQASIQRITASHQTFQRTISDHSFVKNIRQQGTILAFDLNTPEHTSYFNPIKKEAYHFYLEKGVLLRPLGNTVYIMPPYCISEQELKQAYEVIQQSLDWLEKKYV